MSKSTDNSVLATSARLRVRLGVATEGFGRFCLYAMERDGLYKVGKSGDLLTRMRQVANSGATDLTLTASEFFDNSVHMDRAELNAHLLLRKYRQHGEWFKADIKDIDFAVRVAGYSARQQFDQLESLIDVPAPKIQFIAPPTQPPPTTTHNVSGKLLGFLMMKHVERITGLSDQAIRKAIKEGELIAHRNNRHFLFKPEDVDAFVAARIKKTVMKVGRTIKS